MQVLVQQQIPIGTLLAKHQPVFVKFNARSLQLWSKMEDVQMEKTEIIISKVTGTIVVNKTYIFEKLLLEDIDIEEHIRNLFVETPECFTPSGEDEEIVEVNVNDPEEIVFVEKDKPKS
jgi:hypothetical protein